MKKVGEGVYIDKFKNNPQTGVVITFGNEGRKVQDAIDSKGGVDSTYFKRGNNDKRLMELHSLATESPNKWQLIETKASFVAGRGIRLFKREILNGREIEVPQDVAEFDDWGEKIGLDDYWEMAAMQQEFAKEINVLLVLNTDKTVKRLDVIDNQDIRAVRPKEGDQIKEYWVSERFHKGNVTLAQGSAKPYPAFDPEKPTRHPASVIHLIAKKPGQKIYGLPNWYGTKRWGAIANAVPDFYEAAFKNGFFVTHHISFPDNYFDKEGLDEAAKEELREETLNELSASLQSIEEANKVIYTFYKPTADGKTMQEVKITPVENKFNDEAFIKLTEAANLIQASGHGVPGKLAGVQLGSAMGSSGKEIAAEAAYLQDFLTVFDRKRLLKPVEIARRIDGVFKDYHLGIQRIDSYVPGSTSESDVSNPNN